jgi:signal transduction histidine kinase
MHQNKLFNLTRWRLASWYALVMGSILGISGLGVYEAIVHAHWQTLNRELESVAGTLHDSIENTLKQPGRLEPSTWQILPEPSSKRHVLGAMHQGDYYIRLLDRSGKIVDLAGFQPEGLPITSTQGTWQTLKDAQSHRYQQISLTLHTKDNQPWGYMQMGRSVKDIDDYLANVRLILWLGLPIAMILVGGSGWWLSGLAMQPIYQSYNQIQQFTADVAHELRTPLAATQATVESALLTHDLPQSQARDILTTVNRQNQRLTNLVADLLLLARMERQSLPVRHLCCLNDIVSDLVEELASLAIAAGVTLKSDIRVDKLLDILGNEEQLYRLVSNLIVNAIQYTPQGGEVRVILDYKEHQALLQVADTGIGIAPEPLRRIFDRFYRVSSDRSRVSGGAGLGLAIAQAIALAHHGSLQVHSELGKGSTFTIRLPLNRG